MNSMLTVLALGAAGAALTACGSSTSSAEPGENGSLGGPARPLSVDQAMHFDGEGPIRVRGALVVQSGDVVMCDSLAESVPPQCVNGVTLTGFDVGTLPPDTDPVNGVRWVDPIELIVHRDGAKLRATNDTLR